MTVLFCDLVGSTQLSMKLDPEEMHEIVQMYQNVCDREVERYDGYTAQYQGDGIVVYFGYPKARSDAAERAVLAGLKMRDAVKHLSEEIAPMWGVELAVRVGVHSGVVVVGEMGSFGHTEKMALGDAPNIASRVQGAAGVNEVLISEATAKLASNRFIIKSRGEPPLKGVSESLELHVVEGVDRRASWRRLSIQEIFGRDQELATLREALAQSQEGRGQLIEITGETGVGKSQLLWYIAGQVDVPVVDVTCREFQQQTPLGPFADWLSRVLGDTDVTGEEGRRLLEKEAKRIGLGSDTLPGLCALLGLPHPNLPADPAEARKETLDALSAMLLAQGGVVVVDDAHLSDATTLEALNTLAARLEGSNVLLLVGSREALSWQEGSKPSARFALSPLSRDAAVALVRARVGSDVPEKRVDDLVERADGMPIYLVELARAEAQTHTENNEGAVPTSLQGLLMNRLDKAGVAKRTAQEASVIGREFERSELAVITLQMEHDLEHGLKMLVEMELLDQLITATGLTYLFRHQLVRDLAYDSILKRARAQLHRRISNHLELQLDSDTTAKRQRLGRTAQHYLRSVRLRESSASELEKGVRLLMESASESLTLSAYVEAEADVVNANTLAERLPEEPIRWRLETEIFNELSVIHRAVIGFGAPEVEVDLRNARTAAEKLGDDLTVATNSLAIWSLLLGRANYSESLEAAENTLALSARIENQSIRLRSLAACGNSEFWLGRPQKAYDYCTKVLAEYGSDQEGEGLLEHGWDAGVHANQQAIWSAWLIGRKDVLEHESRLQALAQRIGHPLTSAMAENASCVLQVLRRDADAALDAADRLGAIADKFGLGFFQMFAALFRAEALARRGEFGEPFELADQLFRNYQENMGGLAQTFVGAFMVRVYAANNDFEHAKFTVRHALKAVEQCDERVFDSSLRRQEAHLASGSPIDLSELELCGDLDADGRALSASD
ncbi:MAG: ATP-binding protein, partial [Boseongicola sp.]